MVTAPDGAGRRAVFLDRDGVLVIPQMRDGRSFAPRRLEDFQFYPDAKDTLDRLKAAGYLLVVVTNQPDVGHGIIVQSTIEAMHERMRRELPIDCIELCCHTQAEDCACRKPKPGMLLNAARGYGIELKNSFMIGDRASDITAGRVAGCKTIFIDLDYASESRPQTHDYTVRCLREAGDIILGVKPINGGTLHAARSRSESENFR